MRQVGSVLVIKDEARINGAQASRSAQQKAPLSHAIIKSGLYRGVRSRRHDHERRTRDVVYHAARHVTSTRRNSTACLSIMGR